MSIALTRKALYDRVWAEPMQKLAKAFGLSDVALAKTCRRYNIPVPPRGHWAKKQAGRAAPQPPLPTEAPKRLGDKVIVGAMAAPPVKPSPSLAPPVHPLITAEDDPAAAIEIPEDLRIRHPLLQSTKEAWRIQNSPTYRWDVRLPEHFSIDVAKASRTRALRLLQALFTALEQRGHGIACSEKHAILVKVLDETCEIALRERLRQTRTPPSKDPYRRPYDLTPTGEFELRIEQPFRRITLRDRAQWPLEQQLNRVVVQLIQTALAHKARRAEQERARAEQAKRDRRLALAKQRAREERARAKRFLRLAAASTRSKRLAAFAAELRDAVGSVDEQTELGRWLCWIDRYVAEADPLTPFRSRRATLTLYHCAASDDADRLVRDGFRDGGFGYSDDADPAYVEFANVPLVGTYGNTRCVIVAVPEDDVLPYEIRHADKSYRRFRVPTDVVNRVERRLDEPRP
jgi:hypothetical protein